MRAMREPLVMEKVPMIRACSNFLLAKQQIVVILFQ